ncbi:hypothetical protein [Actinomadura macrotermitis]|uniref:Ferric oxidoreductase domain-containing protein n=1 Tax=Actinomadura macrotermitis TaxID=2585200 RepID=A0A7K0BLI8_9ACTN|nr:hypothetical protein [Actinomadura macrotermitis]MQY02048.1 hypothetical protein [Actinomadura macrotermitis]
MVTPDREDRLRHELTAGFGVGTAHPRPGRRRALRRPPRPAVIAGCVALAAAGLLLGVAISAGWMMPPLHTADAFLDFFAGVFALVTLSVAVMIGLLATDRTLLSPAHRVRAQLVHRVLAFVSIAMLLVHLACQLGHHRIGVLQAFVPMSLARMMDFGTGTAASYLMVLAVATGMVRGRFAVTGRPWLWRALHLTAYVAWPLAIVHGLTAGRHPAAWVVAGYLLCVAGVALALAARPVLALRARRSR